MIYAIYNKQDECVCVGNASECCEFLDVSLHHFYSKLISKGNKKYRVFKLGKGNDE